MVHRAGCRTQPNLLLLQLRQNAENVQEQIQNVQVKLDGCVDIFVRLETVNEARRIEDDVSTQHKNVEIERPHETHEGVHLPYPEKSSVPKNAKRRGSWKPTKKERSEKNSVMCSPL